MTAPASFEENFARLEEIVRIMEKGELPLDDMLSRYEEGLRRFQECSRQLSQAEAKIRILVEKGGRFVEEPFEFKPTAQGGEG